MTDEPAKTPAEKLIEELSNKDDRHYREFLMATMREDYLSVSFAIGNLHFSVIAKGERLNSLHLLIMSMLEKYLSETNENPYQPSETPSAGYG